jgi:hypothetical protein
MSLSVAFCGCSGSIDGDADGVAGSSGHAAGGDATGGGMTGGGVSGGTTGGGVSAGTNGGGGTTGGGATGGGATGGTTGGGATGGATEPPPPPESCGEASRPYALSAAPLAGALAPYVATSGWGANLFTQMPAVVTREGAVVVGFSHQHEGSISVTIVSDPPSLLAPITIPDAVLGGLAVTSDGVGVLLFEPTLVGQRRWAQVRRFDWEGNEQFATDLFRSPNLDDEGTRGEPGTGRLGFVGGTGELIAYFGHTRRYGDGVRHQGGYVASLDAGGVATVHDSWFMSHNLDQRLLVDGDRAVFLGLGDAYPKGIVFTDFERLGEDVVHAIAANGLGAANAKLGGLVALGAEYVIPFLTNRSMSATVTPGDYPNIDPEISAEIREASENSRDLGMMRLAKSAPLPPGLLEPLWLDPEVGSELGDDTRLELLKSAPYGSGEMILLAWTEATGSGPSRITAQYTMVVDPDGVVCQGKTRIPEEFAFTSGDDISPRPDGRVVWANAATGSVGLVTLTP